MRLSLFRNSRKTIVKIDGRCHCGYVTFEAEADPETTTLCNCTDCQAMSGAPLRAVIITRPGTFVLLSANRQSIEKPPIAETFVRKASALSAGPRSIRHRLGMRQKRTTCGLDRCANGMNWSPVGSYSFDRSRHGSTILTRSRNSTACRRIDLGRWAANWCECLSVAHSGRGAMSDFESARERQSGHR